MLEQRIDHLEDGALLGGGELRRAGARGPGGVAWATLRERCGGARSGSGRAPRPGDTECAARFCLMPVRAHNPGLCALALGPLVLGGRLYITIRYANLGRGQRLERAAPRWPCPSAPDGGSLTQQHRAGRDLLAAHALAVTQPSVNGAAPGVARRQISRAARAQRLNCRSARTALPGRYTMHLHVMLEPSEDGGYTVTVPSLPGCISEGDTRDEALANIREAIQLYLEPVEDDLAARERTDRAELVEIAV
jgi:predicted RNase H-like HicB family nuclease